MPVLGAVITAFYMFRLWYMTFAGEPRDHHRFDHAHESPRIMTVPLIVLAVFAVAVAWKVPFTNLEIVNLLNQARPVGTLETTQGTLLANVVIPSEEDSHATQIRFIAGLLAFFAAAFGLIGATVVYLWGHIRPADLKRAMRPLYELSWHKWWFDELYHVVWVLPTLLVGRMIAIFDREVIDSIIHASAWFCQKLSQVVDNVGDRQLIDGTVDTVASRTWELGKSLHTIQTGQLRQYVMFIVIGTVVLFVATSLWRYAVAG
jgi:NADH-quinone oxidoreductase subunit L